MHSFGWKREMDESTGLVSCLVSVFICISERNGWVYGQSEMAGCTGVEFTVLVSSMSAFISIAA